MLSSPEDAELSELQTLEAAAPPGPDDSFEQHLGSLEGQPEQPGHVCFWYCSLSFCVALLAAVIVACLSLFAPSSAVGKLICGAPSIKKNLGLAIVDNHLRFYPYVGWWSMPDVQPQELLSSLHAKLDTYSSAGYAEWSRRQCHQAAEISCNFPQGNLTWATGSARNIASAMYMATAIRGVIGEVPQKLRGVFWVRGGDGSGGLEELLVLHYGRWFLDEHTYVLPQAPFTRAWPASVPSSALPNSEKYADLEKTRDEAWSSTYAKTVVWKFRSRNLTVADMQTQRKPFGRVHDGMQLDREYTSTSASTLEEQLGSENGTLWKRGCYAGWNGCNPLDVGSFEMVKIISADGNFVQPHYDDFMAYIGDAELFVHSGWETEVSREEWANWYYSVTDGTPAQFDAKAAL